MKNIELKVLGMSCEGCEKRIERRISSLEEVLEVHASYKENKVIIILKDDVEIEQIKDIIDMLGFEVV